LSRLEQPLKDHCEALAVEYEPSWAPKLERHLELLSRWAPRINLTTVIDPQAALVRHVVDSLALLKLASVRNALTPAADVGSGAGFPGMTLAIALPAVEWTLIEPRKRRGAFLNQVILEAGVTNAHWHQGRVPDTSLEARFQLVVSRATLAPDALVTQAGPLVAPTGALVVMAARQPDWELGSEWELEESYRFELDGAPRWIGSVRRSR
jgi:16S rRNA (guanine527-N7)-methyltransferase